MDPHAIAMRFAPIFAHQVTQEWAAADMLTPVELAGGVRQVRQNPKFLIENTGPTGDWTVPIPDPDVYYSVCETTTHYLLLYAVYHPMDWYKRVKPDNLYDLIRDAFDEHAHDMEGLLMVVRKFPEPTVDALITVAHWDFYLYAEPMVPISKARSEPWGRSLLVRNFLEDVDGHIWIDAGAQRPKVYIQSRGHGLYGDHRRWGGGDYICNYYPQETDVPKPVQPQMRTDRRPYRLVSLFAEDGLWAHRFDDDVFRQRKDGRWGFLAYEKITKGKLMPAAANPPWSWNDRDDPSPIGEIATDPAAFVARYAQALGPFSLKYLENGYWDVRV